jgi:hypothetical protein
MGLMGLGLLVLGFSAPGCSTYTIKGSVIRADVSDIEFVSRDDYRLREPPLSGARITVQRDPDKPNRRMVGTDLSDAHGAVVISLDEFGAGWMEERWLIRASKQGFKTASTMQQLTAEKKNMVLLVSLAPGLSVVPRDDEDLLEEYRKYR